MAILIKVDGSMEMVAYDSREELCALVNDSALDICWDRPGKSSAIVCGDLSALNGSLANDKASELAGEKIYGNAVMLNAREVRWYRKGRCTNYLHRPSAGQITGAKTPFGKYPRGRGEE